MIGNAEEAKFIHEWHHSPRPRWDATAPNAPEGWTYLGSGCYRAGYLAPSGAVYKVQQNASDNSLWQTNLGEWNTWKHLYLTCKMPKYSRLPRLSFYEVQDNGVGVIAIEKLSNAYTYYGTFKGDDGQEHRWSQVCNAITSATGVGDLYGDNLMIDEKNTLLVPTDLGCAPSSDGS